MKTFKCLYKEEYGYSTLNIYMMTAQNRLGQHIAELNQELTDDTIDNKIEKLLTILLESIQENLQTATLFSNSKFNIEYKNPKTGNIEKYVVADDYLVMEYGKRFIDIFNKATPVVQYKLVFTEVEGLSKLDILMMDQTSPIKNMGYVSDKLVAPAINEKVDKLLIKFVDSIQLGHRAKALFQNSEIRVFIKNVATGTETPYIVNDDKLVERFKYNALTLI